jgi:hypothetical protein
MKPFRIVCWERTGTRDVVPHSDFWSIPRHVLFQVLDGDNRQFPEHLLVIKIRLAERPQDLSSVPEVLRGTHNLEKSFNTLRTSARCLGD